MVIRHPGALRSLVLPGSERALGQAYVQDDFDIDGDLESAFPVARHLLRLHPSIRDRFRLAQQLLHLPAGRASLRGRGQARLHGRIHSPERDREAVTYHYDTSNEFFALFLDRDMVYSCGYFRSPGDDLEAAQQQKLDYTCRKLRLKKGQRLLDIGCGWGGLIRYASQRYGVSSLGITLSEPQARLAGERIRQDGLEEKCRATVRDYREVGAPGSYDAIVSIGMVEHVGASMLPEYFAQAWRLLRPGGVFLNHGIARRLHAPAHPGASFTQAYVFPDTDPVPLCTSVRAAEEAGFEARDVESLREHYAMTLRHWVRRLDDRREEAVRVTNEATYRVWRMFLTGSAVEFDTGGNNVYQSLLVKPHHGASGLPLTREDWYDSGRHEPSPRAVLAVPGPE
jgi:cyclopropane-fatty-acyl-phospholipid synthase